MRRMSLSIAAVCGILLFSAVASAAPRVDDPSAPGWYRVFIAKILRFVHPTEDPTFPKP